MTKHTPEPWFCDSADVEGAERAAVRAEDGALVAIAWAGERDGIGVMGDAEQDANSARIVACVNACAGLPDPALVPELVKMLRRVLDTCTQDFGCCEVEGVAEAARALLARAEGKGASHHG